VGAASPPLPRCCRSHAKCPRLPIFKRAAIQAKGIAVLQRNSRANCAFPRSPLRRAPRSASISKSLGRSELQELNSLSFQLETSGTHRATRAFLVIHHQHGSIL
jgi:hypothetical protein